jgi:hypothetical protein
MTEKPCNVCGEQIEMRQGTDGKWFPANPTTGQRHVCPTKQPVGNPTYTNPVTAPNHQAPVSDTELKGKVTVFSSEKRQITLKDVDGILHPFTWTEPLDIIMRKWKEGYYLKITHEGYILKNASYWQEGKDAFPKTHPPGSGGRPFTPRNEKPIIYQVCFKEACAMAREIMIRNTSFPPELDPANSLMDWALERAKKDSKALIEAAGCQ